MDGDGRAISRVWLSMITFSARLDWYACRNMLLHGGIGGWPSSLVASATLLNSINAPMLHNVVRACDTATSYAGIAASPPSRTIILLEVGYKLFSAV